MKFARLAVLAAFFLSTIAPAAPVWANPSFSGADSGNIRIEVNGGVYTIYASDRAIGSFDSFGNLSGETINSIQDASTFTALYRVIGTDPSVFFGALNANSRIFLINPNGIVFAPGSQINAAGLTASTLDMANEDFLSGRYHFERTALNTQGYILNQGNLVAQNGGYIALLGSAVKNEGNIAAQGGSVVMAAGDEMLLSLDGTGRISVAVDEPIRSDVYDIAGNRINEAIANSGNIQANGGLVVLSAKAAEEVFDRAINHSGIIEAKSISSQNGEILLDGGNKGIVAVSGRLDATGLGAGEKGGHVTVLGEKVGLFGNGAIDVSGDQGGGTVLFGGDYQGKGDVPTSQYAYTGINTSIRADAVTSGNGGKVIVWSDQATRAHGAISARGGSISGDGGFVETSGKYLEVLQAVDVSAARGESGLWLLDPEDIDITGANANITSSGAGDPGPVAFSPTAINAVTTIDVATINAALDLGSNVTISTAGAGTSTTGTITVSSAIAKTADGGSANGSTLTLTANDGIIINNTISSTTGTLGVTFTATGAVTINADITTNGGVFTSTGTTFNQTAGNTISTAGGQVTINHTGAVTLSDSINSTTGSVTVSSDASITLGDSAIVATTGNIALSAGTTISAAAATNGVAEISTGGNVTLTGDAIGSTTNHLQLTGDASGDSTLTISSTAVGAQDVFIDALTDEFSTISMTLAESEADVAIGLTGGDSITITGALASSTIDAVLTGTNPAFNYTLTENQTVNVNSIAAGSGGASVTATTGNIAVTSFTATGGTATLAATAGSITDANAGVNNITATSLVASAATGIDLDTTVTNLTATNTGAGNINLDEADGANVLNVAASNGNATVTTAAGDLAVTTVTATGGTATLTAAAGAITDANAATNNITATSLVVSSSTGVDLDTTVTNLTASTTGAGNIIINEADGANVLNAAASNGNTTVTSTTGNLAVTTVTATGGTATLTASAGSITDANTTTNNITATSLVASATTGIDLDTTVTNLTATNTGAGNINLDEANGANVLNVAASNGSATVTTTTGDLAVTTVTATGGTATLTATVGALTDANAAAVNVVATTFTGSAATGIDLDTTVTNASAVTTGVGNINLSETDGAVFTNLQTANGSITVTAAGSSTVTRAVSVTDADANDISITSSVGNVTISEINAGTTAGDISVTATAGAILRGASGTNLVGDQISLTSQNNIGSPSLPISYAANNLVYNITGLGTAYLISFSGGALDTSLSSGDLVFATTGDIYIRNGQALNGSIDLTAGGNIYVTEDSTGLSALGNIRLVAGGAIGTPGRPLYVTSSQGSVTVTAGGHLQNLSVNLTGNLPSNQIALEGLPPALILYNGALLGGGNVGALRANEISASQDGRPFDEAAFAGKTPQHAGFKAAFFDSFIGHAADPIQIEIPEFRVDSSLLI